MSPCGGIVADTQQHDVRIVPGVQQLSNAWFRDIFKSYVGEAFILFIFKKKDVSLLIFQKKVL